MQTPTILKQAAAATALTVLLTVSPSRGDEIDYQPPLAYTTVHALRFDTDGHRVFDFTPPPNHYVILWRSGDLTSPGCPVTLRIPANGESDSITDQLPPPRNAFYRLAIRPNYLPGDIDRDGIPDHFEAAFSPQLELPDPPELNLDPFDPTDASAPSDVAGRTNRQRYNDYLDSLLSDGAYSRPDDPYARQKSNDQDALDPDLEAILGIDVVNDAALAFDISPAQGLGSVAPTIPGFQFKGEFRSQQLSAFGIGYYPEPFALLPDSVAGVEFICQLPCHRVFVAVSLTEAWFEQWSAPSSRSPVVSFPLADATPLLRLSLDEGTPSTTTARVLTATADPRSWIGTEPPRFLNPNLPPNGNLDTHLTDQGFLPLQDLDRSNANDFGDLTLTSSTVALFDAALLTDPLTNSTECTFGTLVTDCPVGLPDRGAQTGTFNITSTAGQAVASAGDTTIDRDGTYPWLRDTFDPDAPVESHPTANVPTGLRSDSLVQTRDAHLTAHSLEFACTATTAPDGQPTGIAIAGSTLATDGLPVLDPLASVVTAASVTYSTDPLGNPLGYIHLLAPDAPLTLTDNSLDAATEITAEATTLTLDGGTLHAGTPDGRITLHAQNLTATNSPSLTAGNAIAVLGTAAEQPGEPSHAGLATDATAAAIRIDHFQTLGIHTSTLTADTITASTRARIVTNHGLQITATTTIENGQIATPALTVSDGATLALTGPDAAVYTNTHNYGKPGYGTLTINGSELTPPDNPFPAFHLRPPFNAD